MVSHLALQRSTGTDLIAVKGVYFQWNNEPTNPAVKDWNVTEMRVSHPTVLCVLEGSRLTCSD